MTKNNMTNDELKQLIGQYREILRAKRSLPASMDLAGECPPLSRFWFGVHREDWSQTERQHLHTCRKCQKLVGRLKEQVRHPAKTLLWWHCLRPVEDIRRHVELDGCHACAEELKGIRQMIEAPARLAEIMGREAAENLQTCWAWLQRQLAAGPGSALATVAVGTEPLRRPAFTASFSSKPLGKTAETSAPPLMQWTFAEPADAWSCIVERVKSEGFGDPAFRLDIKGPAAAEVRLLHLWFVNLESGQRSERIVIFPKDKESASIDLEDLPPDQSVPGMRIMAPEDLQEVDTDVLKASWEADCSGRRAREQRVAWKAFAQMAIERVNMPVVRGVLGAIQAE